MTGSGTLMGERAGRMRALGSSVALTSRVTEQVDGEIVHITNYRDIDEARAAVERLAGGRA